MRAGGLFPTPEQKAYMRARLPVPAERAHAHTTYTKPRTSSHPRTNLQVALLTHLCYMAYYESVGLTAEEYVRDAVAALIWDARSDDLEAMGLLDRAAEVEAATSGTPSPSPAAEPSPPAQPEPEPSPEPSPKPSSGAPAGGAADVFWQQVAEGGSHVPYGCTACCTVPPPSPCPHPFQAPARTAVTSACLSSPPVPRPAGDKPASKPGKATAVTDSSGGKKKDTGEDKPDSVGPPGTYTDWILDCKGGRVRCWNLVLASMG